MELKTAVDEMFRKVGRNLYIIQQVEMMLKAYLSHSSICGSMSEAGDPQQRQLDRFALQTMGGLVTQYLCLIDPGYKYPENNSPDKFSVQFEIKVDSNTFMRKCQRQSNFDPFRATFGNLKLTPLVIYISLIIGAMPILRLSFSR